jgi:hypothetical protein
LEAIIAAPVLKVENTAVGIRHADHEAPSIRKKLALTSLTSCDRSVGIVRLRTEAMDLLLLLLLLLLNCTLNVYGSMASMFYFLLEFTLVSNSALPFWKCLVSEFLLGIPETSRCSAPVSHVFIIPLLDVHQLLMLFHGTLTYSQSRTLFPFTLPSSVAILFTGSLLLPVSGLAYS